MGNQRVVNFIHFPKVGGKSIRHQLEEHFKGELYRYNNNPVARGLLLRKVTRLRHKLNLKKKHRIFFGHFGISDSLYNSRVSKNIVMVREPIDWVCSMYFYNIQKYQITLTLPEFIKLYNLSSIYEKFIGKQPKQQFDIIGVYENYDKFLDAVSECLKIRLKDVKRNITLKTKGQYIEYLEKDKNLYSEVHTLMRHNTVIYEELRNQN